MAENPLFPNIRAAIQSLGHDAPDSLDALTETADLAEDFHIKALDLALVDCDPGFASSYAALEASDDGDDPVIKWALKWKLPTNSVKIREVYAGDVRLVKDSGFEMGGKDEAKDGRFMMTNESSIAVRYTFRESNPNNWEPDFVRVYEAKLAEVLAFPFTRSLRIAQAAEAKYIREKGRYTGEDRMAGGPETTSYNGISSALE